MVPTDGQMLGEDELGTLMSEKRDLSRLQPVMPRLRKFTSSLQFRGPDGDNLTLISADLTKYESGVHVDYEAGQLADEKRGLWFEVPGFVLPARSVARNLEEPILIFFAKD